MSRFKKLFDEVDLDDNYFNANEFFAWWTGRNETL